MSNPRWDWNFRNARLDVAGRFWKMDNRFWLVFDPDFTKIGSMVVGFIAREELCCESAELGMMHPVREIDRDELGEILEDHGSVLIWDLHTRDSLMMTKRGD